MWNIAYSVLNGEWTDVPSTATQSLTTGTKSAVGSTVGVVVVSNLVNSSSFASIWSMVNQLQLLLLLLLTRAFIPKDAIDVIIGSKFAMAPYDFLPFKEGSNFKFIIEWFDYEQSNIMLSKIGLGSGSIFVNNYSLFCALVVTILVHLFIYFAIKFLSLISSIWYWWVFVCLKYTLSKIFAILTFGYYIRTIMETYQFLLIWSLSEIIKINTKSSSFTASLWISLVILIYLFGYLFYVLYSNMQINY